MDSEENSIAGLDHKIAVLTAESRVQRTWLPSPLRYCWMLVRPPFDQSTGSGSRARKIKQALDGDVINGKSECL